eukprot:TRINITY_DN10579_c0_g1_i1.p1 TRINITY_DN10579_c0_g1~~TRINITY_DN10579_c0_g1_i1.p1  ORF type:complete len:683 (+),score=135.84 TRINITY_DN10579_c0_g1_i1:60-2108(+)
MAAHEVDGTSPAVPETRSAKGCKAAADSEHAHLKDPSTSKGSKEKSNGRRTMGGEDGEQSKGGKGTFVDAAAMKEKVRQNLSKPKYNVTDYYHDTGVFQLIARSPIFDKMTLSVIAANAIWIAVDTDYNDSAILLTADPMFIVAENFFCVFFSFEWFSRFMSFRRKRDGLKDGWFVFDSFMVAMMVLETWVFTIILLFVMSGSDDSDASGGNTGVMRLARLLRLSRMARMGKLLRVMPELMIMLKGMKAATRSVSFTLLLLAIITYIFGIAFAQLADGTSVAETYFSSVTESMYSLLVFGIFLDNFGVMAGQLRNEWTLCIVFFVFVLIGSLTVMNMLVGVLCEVVSAVASTEQEEMLVTYVHERLSRVMAILDSDGGGTINKDEFVQILDNIEAVRCLSDVGVDVFALIDLADYIFEGDDSEGIELDFSRFMEVVLQLRGTNQATVKDIVDLRKFVRMTMLENYKQTASIIEKLDSQALMMTEALGRRIDSRSPSSFGGDLSVDARLQDPVPCPVVAACESASFVGKGEELGTCRDAAFLRGSWAPFDDDAAEFRIPMESDDFAGGLLQEVVKAEPKQMQSFPASHPLLAKSVQSEKCCHQLPAKSLDSSGIDLVISGIPRLRLDSCTEEAELESIQRHIADMCRQLAICMNDSIAMAERSAEKRLRCGRQAALAAGANAV